MRNHLCSSNCQLGVVCVTEQAYWKSEYSRLQSMLELADKLAGSAEKILPIEIHWDNGKKTSLEQVPDFRKFIDAISAYKAARSGAAGKGG